MTWIIIMAFIANGELHYSETIGYDSKDACEIALARAFGIYREQGIRIRDMSGGCYLVQQ